MSVIGTGPWVQQGLGLHAITSYATYSFYSGVLTTTDSFEDNIINFGTALDQLYIVNAGSHAIAFQFPEYFVQTGAVVNTACGVVLANSQIFFHPHLNKKGIKIRSLSDGDQSTPVYIFGI
jgi:hypothetical protein